MRKKPSGYRSALAAQWLCAAVDYFLGEADLSSVPALMSGFASVLDHPAVGHFAPVAFALRQMGVTAASELHLRQAVLSALAWEEDHLDDDDYVEPPYQIDAEQPGYPFTRRVPQDDPVLLEMAQALADGLPFEEWGMETADSARPMAITAGAFEGAERISIDMSVAPVPPAPPRHDLDRRPRGPIVIGLEELVDVARRMDALDAEYAGRPRGNWESRLRETGGEHKFHVLCPDRAAGRLQETDRIHLNGLHHLIGLPGTGKTTLIVLLLMWLDERGYRVVVLLPSIEASLNLLADLRFYGADVGLLVGQSPQTRIEHARKFGERLGSDEARGFGRSAPGADLLGLNCALGAFDADPEGHEDFPHLHPPCLQVLQRGLKKDGTPKAKESARLCPLSGWCGRLRAPRELTDRRIWLGHILSLDTRISPHFTDARLRHLEAVAMGADLVVIDEADGAQATLDRKALASLDLTGSEESYEHALNRDLFLPVSAGRNDMTAASVQQYSAAASDFRKLNHSLVTQIQRDHRRGEREGYLSRFADTFVTGNNVLTTLFSPPDLSVLEGAEKLAEERRFNALRAFWDGCVKAALFRRTDVDDDASEYGFDTDILARDIGKTTDEVSAAATVIAGLIRDWISDPLPTRRDRVMSELCVAMFAFAEPRQDLGREERAELLRFLVGVTTVILQFLTLLAPQQAMVAEGVHDAPLFRQGISEDLARVVPEALIGRLSGLRFQVEDGGSRPTVRLQYMSFRGTPRALMYHLHHLLRHEGREHGPAVLLASATSYMVESPSFHIPVGPDFVLRRAGADDEGWRESRYVFASIPDPSDPSKRLRFSGSPLGQREQILRKMVDHFFVGEEPLAMRMCQDFDPGRKVALVVNSYAQVRQVKDHVRRIRPELAERVVAVIDRAPERNEGDWVTASQVERLGVRDDWDVLVFPMKSLARGVNIVFEQGPRRRDALLGTVVFMTRPHPATESLDLVAGIAGAETMAFDQRELPPGWGTAQLSRAWSDARRDLLLTVQRLLRFPVQASRLGDLAVPFTADMMVDILQTIGRAMRNGCKARVLFADAAWAPRSAQGDADRRETSMLVLMRDILRARLDDPDPVDREVYRALYEPFLHPLEQCANVIFPGRGSA